MLLGAGTAMVYPTLLAAIGDVAHPAWRARSVGVYRLWRDAVSPSARCWPALSPTRFALVAAIWVVAALTGLSGVVVAQRMYETKRSMTMGHDLLVDPDTLRDQVREKYRDVAVAPDAVPLPHRPTARRQARLRHRDVVDGFPDRAVESFAGVGEPVLAAPPRARANGSSTLAPAPASTGSSPPPGRSQRRGRRRRHDRRDARQVHRHRRAARSRPRGVPQRARRAMPVEDGWADVVISNGVINLCADKRAVFAEIRRVSPPWRCAAVRRHRQRPPRTARSALRDIDLWTGLNRRRAAP